MGELDDAMARQQQQRADADQSRLEQIEAGRRLLDEFVALMKRHGKTPVPVFRVEHQDLGQTKLFRKVIAKHVTSYALIGQGWLIQARERYDYAGPTTIDCVYYLPGQGTVDGGQETAPPRASIQEERINKAHKLWMSREVRVPTDMPTAGKIAIAENLPSEWGIAGYSGRADELATFARQVLGS